METCHSISSAGLHTHLSAEERLDARLSPAARRSPPSSEPRSARPPPAPHQLATHLRHRRSAAGSEILRRRTQLHPPRITSPVPSVDVTVLLPTVQMGRAFVLEHELPPRPVEIRLSELDDLPSCELLTCRCIRERLRQPGGDHRKTQRGLRRGVAGHPHLRDRLAYPASTATTMAACRSDELGDRGVRPGPSLVLLTRAPDQVVTYRHQRTDVEDRAQAEEGPDAGHEADSRTVARLEEPHRLCLHTTPAHKPGALPAPTGCSHVDPSVDGTSSRRKDLRAHDHVNLPGRFGHRRREDAGQGHPPQSRRREPCREGRRIDPAQGGDDLAFGDGPVCSRPETSDQRPEVAACQSRRVHPGPQRLGGGEDGVPQCLGERAWSAGHPDSIGGRRTEPSRASTTACSRLDGDVSSPPRRPGGAPELRR